jgi:hypothetical protein
MAQRHCDFPLFGCCAAIIPEWFISTSLPTQFSLVVTSFLLFHFLLLPLLSLQPTKTHHVSCQTQNACRQYLILHTFHSVLSTDFILHTNSYLKPLMVSENVVNKTSATDICLRGIYFGVAHAMKCYLVTHLDC